MRSYKFYMSLNQFDTTAEKMKVQTLASQYFPAFTIYNSVNFELDKHERGIVLEVLTDYLETDFVAKFIHELKILIKQERILITIHVVDGAIG